MIVDPATGWLEGVRRVESPNSDERPPATTLDLIVVHGISLPPGRFGEGWIDRFFLNELPAAADPYFATIAEMKVSAHVLVARDGSLTQYVSFNRRAWHAGRSVLLRAQRRATTSRSGSSSRAPTSLPYMRAQYETLAALVRALRRAYPSLRGADIVGHSDIAPGRKTDPGAAFDWDALRELLGSKRALT